MKLYSIPQKAYAYAENITKNAINASLEKLQTIYNKSLDIITKTWALCTFKFNPILNASKNNFKAVKQEVKSPTNIEAITQDKANNLYQSHISSFAQMRQSEHMDFSSILQRQKLEKENISYALFLSTYPVF